MKQANVLILDFNTAPHLAETLQKILCAADRLKVHVQRANGPAANGPTPLAGVIAACQPDLCCLTCAPELLKQLLGRFRELRKALAGVPVIAVTEAGEPEEMLELLRLGVTDFITLPLKPFDIHPRIWRLLQQPAPEETLTKTLKEKLGLRQLIGDSPAFLEQIRKIPVVAKSDAGVLILGETGTGKELCARAIHYLSPRATQPFVPVNCGAIPAELVENELFGHEAGAYTSAATARPGLLQEARGGTLLLDEVDSLPLLAQAKLLRFLQEKEFRPLGSTKTVHADVRVIAASNNDLGEQVRRGKLRQDLYYRLNVIPFTLPPLRERAADILPLANHFAAKYAEAFDKAQPAFALDAQQMLLCYDWPGNVRELENVVERALVFAEGELLHGHELGLPRAQPAGAPESFQQMKARAVAQFEKAAIQGLLLAHHGNITRAAQAARKNRRAFFALMRKHSIDARHLSSGH